MFNFFVVLSGFVTAGIGATLQGPPRLAILSIFLGLLLVLMSFVFWKVDQRAAFLVKHAEAACIQIEHQLLPPAAQLFVSEQATFDRATDGKGIGPLWTFGRSLRVAFAGVALVGAGASITGGLRATGVISWESAIAVRESIVSSQTPHRGGPRPSPHDSSTPDRPR